jgi:hypothetical protein
MKERLELLAGLVEEDDLEITRNKVSESYKEQIESDTKLISEAVRVVEDDQYRFNKFVGIEDESNDPEFGEPINESVAMGGFGPGFKSWDGSNKEILNPFARAGMMEAGYYKDLDLPGEVEEREDLPSLAAFKILDQISNMKPVPVDSPELIDLMDAGLIRQNRGGNLEVTEKGSEYVARGLHENADNRHDNWWPHRRMSNGSQFVRYREDHYDRDDVPTMDPEYPEDPHEGWPAGYQFYPNDPTYIKLMKKKEDPLDLAEAEDQELRFSKFWDKYLMASE